IPFDETRNYVMRVAEALPIYRARIAGHSVPFVPSWDLGGGVSAPQVSAGPLVLSGSAHPRPTPEWVSAAFGRAERLALTGAEDMPDDPPAPGTHTLAEDAPRPGPQIAEVARAIGPPAGAASTAPPTRPDRAGGADAEPGSALPADPEPEGIDPAAVEAAVSPPEPAVSPAALATR